MTTSLSSLLTSPLFTPELGLSWLRTDPTKQQPEAFEGMKLVTIAPGCEVMAPCFPGGTRVAVTRVLSPEEVTDGVYFLETSGPHAQKLYGTSHYVQFGRLVGSSRLKPARFIELHMAVDNPAADSPEYHFPFVPAEDGTRRWNVHFCHTEFQQSLWRVTHYVSLPTALATPALASRTGTTLQQQRWLAEETQLREAQAEELTAQVLGGSVPMPDHRVVLTGENLKAANLLLSKLSTMPPYQAKRRKSGALSVTWQGIRWDGSRWGMTEYYKLEEVALVLEWFTALTRLQRAEDSVVLAVARIRRERNAEAPMPISPEQARPAYLTEPIEAQPMPLISGQEMAQAA